MLIIILKTHVVLILIVMRLKYMGITLQLNQKMGK